VHVYDLNSTPPMNKNVMKIESNKTISGIDYCPKKNYFFVCSSDNNVVYFFIFEDMANLVNINLGFYCLGG